MGKVVTREWRRAERAKLEFAFVLAFIDIIKVLDSISWVRCASNNVFRQNIGMFKRLCTQTYMQLPNNLSLDNPKLAFLREGTDHENYDAEAEMMMMMMMDDE